MTVTLTRLRRYAVARSVFSPRPLDEALAALGFVQADPIRAPARAQDLTLRHRVPEYRAGDLERAYRHLDVEEDFFVNYGFLDRALQARLHPRTRLGAWPRPGKKMAATVLAFVRQRGEVHPRDVDAHFAHGAVTNYWGGSSSATTHALDHLHYRGLLRVAGRDAGIRRYAAREVPLPVEGAAAQRACQDAIIDAIVRLYAPVPAPTFAWLVGRLRLATPQWQTQTRAALSRAKARLAHARVADLDWYWPADEAPGGEVPDDCVRLLAPFDPVVWDRRRFEAFWDWRYRFEAYTPAARRTLGYYAMPLLWRERVVGWGNLSVVDSRLAAELGYVSGQRPRDRAFARALEAELASMAAFLGVSG
ncbi:MAG: YcaQ family DNA glycosylase [Acidobacteria bacterium]|nr:YcaQ family DNA glycosylase [Acidobacteriota bacterium]